MRDDVSITVKGCWAKRLLLLCQFCHHSRGRISSIPNSTVAILGVGIAVVEGAAGLIVALAV